MAKPVRIAALAGAPSEGYAYRLGLGLDEFLNVLILNGDPGDTMSDHAAVAQRDGKRWGCWFCDFLSVTVETQHCPKTLAGENMTRLAALKAGAMLFGGTLIVAAVVEVMVLWVI